MNKVELVGQVTDMTHKAALPLAVTATTVMGFALPDIVAVLTIIYLVIHIGYIVHKWIKGK